MTDAVNLIVLMVAEGAGATFLLPLIVGLVFLKKPLLATVSMLGTTVVLVYFLKSFASEPRLHVSALMFSLVAMLVVLVASVVLRALRRNPPKADDPT